MTGDSPLPPRPTAAGGASEPPREQIAATGTGNHRALGRLITRIENHPESAASIVAQLWSRTGRGRRLGITGPPGVGKSTLADQLIAAARAEGLTVAVIAVDPSSPFSGGAILGDRVRMLRHSGDTGVYIRSMAARAHLGGLAAATRDVAYVLDAFAFDLIVVETVGVGQSELEVMRLADTVVVITAPGLGDAVQTLKAGILEIADVLVVNKADRPGARETAMQLRDMRRLIPHHGGWDVPVLETAAAAGTGTAELWSAIRRHEAYLRTSGELQARRERRAEREVLDLVEAALASRVRETLHGRGGPADILAQAKRREADPHSAAKAILDRLVLPGAS
jgi:LAO/AO transport system kinase